MKQVTLFFLLFISTKVVANGLHVAGGTYVNYVDMKSGSQFSLLNDLRFGYRIDYTDQSSLALLLATESQKIPNEIKDETRESFGVSVAYYLGQFYTMGAYFPQSKIEGGEISGTRNGSGLRFDLGMNF